MQRDKSGDAITLVQIVYCTSVVMYDLSITRSTSQPRVCVLSF